MAKKKALENQFFMDMNILLKILVNHISVTESECCMKINLKKLHVPIKNQ